MLQDYICKFLIDMLIHLPVLIVVMCVRWQVMKNRPEHFIAKPFVIPFNLFPGKEYRDQALLPELLCDIILLRCIVCFQSGPSDPEVIAFPVNRTQTCGKSAFAGYKGYFSFMMLCCFNRKPVGYNDCFTQDVYNLVTTDKQ